MANGKVTENQKLLGSVIFWIVGDFINEDKITILEALAILDKLHEYYRDDVVHPLDILTKEEVDRCLKK